MSLLTKPPFRAWRLVLLFLLLAISGTLIVAGLKAESSKSLSKPETQDQRSRQPETEIVTVTPTGFEPGEITRSQGRFLLAIDNRTGLEELQLYLERETGSRVSLSRKRKLAWREAIDLPPGRYSLRAANDQSWHCRITINQ